MKLYSFAWLASAVLACVPGTTELAPAGGVEVTFVGTDATNRKPFVTDDGYTVTVDSFAVRANATGQRPPFTYAAAPSQVITATPGCHMVLRQLGLGLADVKVDLSSPFLEQDPYYAYPNGDKPPCATEEATFARFGRAADNFERTGGTEGPAIVMFAHGAKDGKTTRLELAIANSGDSTGLIRMSTQAVTVRIEANKGVSAVFTLDAKVLFTDSDGKTAFAPYAAADTDGDGVVSGAELTVLPASCADSVPRYPHPYPSGDDDDTTTTTSSSTSSSSSGGDPIGPGGVPPDDMTTCVSFADKIAESRSGVILAKRP